MPRTYTFDAKRQQRWTQAHTKRAIELRKQGLSYEAIGKELGFTAATAMRYVKGPQPKPESESKSKYVHYFTTPVDNVSAMDRVDSMLLATHISIYKLDEQGHEHWVHDVEIPKALLDIFSTHQTAVELYNQL